MIFGYQRCFILSPQMTSTAALNDERDNLEIVSIPVNSVCQQTSFVRRLLPTRPTFFQVCHGVGRCQ